jgi:hypothetical protein
LTISATLAAIGSPGDHPRFDFLASARNRPAVTVATLKTVLEQLAAAEIRVDEFKA